ncbi:MAG: phosphate ABC transporter permease family protein [Planctomycetia bacterium]
MLIWTLVLILALAAAAYAAGNARAAGLSTAGGTRLHSLPAYHGLYVAAGALTGGLALALAGGVLFGAQSWLATLAAAAGAVIGAAALYSGITVDRRARNAFERFVMAVLIACSAVAVLTTIGIVFSVLFETLNFFRSVSPIEFLFDTHWSPTSNPPSFGFIPLLAGTFLITFLAILVAGPLGLLSAIYMA